MPIKLHISPRIVPNISSLYNDVSRIFMEYIDNSLDSAEKYFDETSNAYKKEINITISIVDLKYNKGFVLIEDNCSGVNNLEKIVQEVGNSDKKAQPWTNGEFGYGIYSFMAASSTLELTTKEVNAKALYIPIRREQFDTNRQEDVSFPDPKIIKNFQSTSGTLIKLSGLDRNSWKQIDIKTLHEDIEKHFELLLRRGYLNIRLVASKSSDMKDKQEFLCKPYDYSQFEGDVYDTDESSLSYTKLGPKPAKVKLPLKTPIKIFIKITKGKEINRRPVFIAKGRRIGEIKDIKSFKSKHRSEIWDHPNVTGFIDLKDFLDPTIARNDFKNTNKSRALFSHLIELEELILEFIKKVNQESEERHYEKLEDHLNKVLSQLAKLDSMAFRSDYIEGTDRNLKAGGKGSGSGNEGDQETLQDGTVHGGDTVDERKNDIVSSGEGDAPSSDHGGNAPLSEPPNNPFEDTGLQGSEKKKSGFNIRIDEQEPVIDTRTDKPKRSLCVGGEIRIFKKHPEFQERVQKGRQGNVKITNRLITYLAGEITVHYKDSFHTRKATQPEYDVKLFEDLVSFIYSFENKLKDLSGKNLSDLT